jgi:hypothetical protein
MFESAELVEFYIYFLTFLLILISDRTNIFLFVNVKQFCAQFCNGNTYTCVCECRSSRILDSPFFLKILRYELKKERNFAMLLHYVRYCTRRQITREICSYLDNISLQMYLSYFYISNLITLQIFCNKETTIYYWIPLFLDAH